MATSGIWNHAIPANSLAANSTTHPAATTASSPGGDGGSNISANDFLTLLVTEMRNQDPTANTDPNAYINQLVQVNSLEQLISINQTLSTDLGSSATGSVRPGSGANHDVSPKANAPIAAAVAPATHAGTPIPVGVAGQTTETAAGNLAVPKANSAAERVARALTRVN